MALADIVRDARACVECKGKMPHDPHPVLQCHENACILIAGQAPGWKVHESGVPFDDASGDRLRDWMGIDKPTFYDPTVVAILPMGFCYPGTGKSGDLPPRKECAPLWRQPLLDALPNIGLTLVIGQYAMAWHMPEVKKQPLTQTVRDWRDHIDFGLIPLPHPSPRNNIWMAKNPWFGEDVLPTLREKIAELLSDKN